LEARVRKIKTQDLPSPRLLPQSFETHRVPRRSQDEGIKPGLTQ
jgi:hypothetical protein